ncbi:MAG: MFS transporter [Spirochaetales bacterium]
MTNKKLNTLNGVLNSISTDLVAPFAVIFALRLGSSSFQTAMLSSGPAIAGLLVLIPGARWVDRQRDKKRVTAWLMAANRLFYLLMVAVPFLLPAWQAATFIMLVTVMNAPGAIANSAWQGYMARIFPANQRADAFADRNKAMNIFGTATTFTAGMALDVIGTTWGYQLMFFGAFLVALAEVQSFTKLREPTLDPAQVFADSATQPEPPPPFDQIHVPATTEAAPLLPLVFKLKRKIREIASNKTFVRYLLASVVFYFSWQTPWTLFSLYQVKELHAGNFALGLLTLANTGGNLMGYKFWVGQIEKKGNLHVQWMSASALILVPLTYALTGFLPRISLLGIDLSLYIIGTLSILVGAALSGLILSMFNSLLEATPEKNRTSYIAYFNTANTITAIIAPLWGVTAYELWGWQTAFWICFGQRLVGVSALILLWRAK